ncbi:MAG: STAS/SEC14 domain-containing protein [Armatimonadota bacterium]|nr:STAS/SEC14 domain-containing protein [Armatimonadota bacterium]
MLETLNLPDDNILGFRMDGSLEPADVQRAFAALEPQLKSRRKVRVYMEVGDFSMRESAAALWEDFKTWLTHPGLVGHIEKAALVTDEAWLKTVFTAECALIPTLTGTSFGAHEKSSALAWLRSEDSAPGGLSLTLAQWAELGALKAAGGFALGLLVAARWSGERRQKIGWAVLLGAIVAGLPLGLHLLNRLRNR